jgi:nicotinamide mononucleotide transporter
MADVLEGAWQALQALSTLEAVAVVLAVAYLVLAVRESIWCWPCAFGSTAIYVWLFHDVALISESLLNAFYLVMAIYGYYQWRHGGQRHHGLTISVRPWQWHLRLILVTGACVPPLGWFMATSFGAALPYLDAFTTCFAVVTTWMVARKILENWIYWFVIDSVSIYLYLQKGLHLTAALFVVYLVLIVIGYRRWLREFRFDGVAESAA